MAKATNTYEIELMKAIKRKEITKVKELLKTHSIEFNDTKNDDRYYDYDLIMKALSPAQIELAIVLIKDGFRVYNKCESKNTILDCAVRLQNFELVELLFEKGASVNMLSTNQYNLTPLHTAIDRKQYNITKLFLFHLDVEHIDDKYLLHYAIKLKDIAAIQQLIEKGCSLNKQNNKNLTPLCLALKNSFNIETDFILSNYTLKNITPNNYDNMAPLYVAVMRDNLQVIKKHIDSGIVSIDSPLNSNGTWSCLEECSGLTLLNFAINCKKVEIVEFLLSRGADILFQKKTKSLLLHVVFDAKVKGIWKSWQDFEDNNKMMDLLLKASTKLQHNPVDEHGVSHFHVACSRDEPAIIEHYLKLGIPIDQPVEPDHPSFGGFTPLHFAAKFRCTKTLEYLLKHGADVKKIDAKNMTALHIAAEQSCVESVRLLLKYGADTNLIDSNGNSPVHWAFKLKNFEIIDQLLSAQNAALSNPTDNKGLSHFHIACTRNNVDVVKNFIENGVLLDQPASAQPEKNNDSPDSYWSSYTPLHFAVGHNRSKIVQLLLQRGANVQKKDIEGFTPLHLACYYTHDTFLEFIKITLRDLNNRGEIYIIDKPVSDITRIREVYDNGFSGSVDKIDWMANRNEHLEVINLLLNYGADVNDTDDEGNTPMFYAYSVVHERKDSLKRKNQYCSGDLWIQMIEDLSNELYERRKLILDILFKQKVNLNVCYKNSSILHYICSKDDEFSNEMLELFLKKGANVDATDDENLTALHKATLRDNNNLVKILLNYNANVDCIDPEDNATPLMIAAEQYYTDILEMLIYKGANVNAKNFEGSTALHILTQLYSEDDDKIASIDSLIYSLVKAGADVNSQNFKGQTALHVILESFGTSYDVFKTLLEFGADIGIQDNKGRSVCCYFYEKFLKPELKSQMIFYDVKKGAKILREHIIKMNAIGLAVTEKVKSFHDLTNKFKQLLLTEKESNKEIKMISMCKDEVKALKSEKINDNYMLYDVIFKDENALSYLVENSKFKSFIHSESFVELYPNCGYIIKLKYQTGLDRAKLLPLAKSALTDLAGLHLPDICSEHIFSYFTNIELKESLRVLSSFLDYCNVMESTDDNIMQLKESSSTKSQKVC